MENITEKINSCLNKTMNNYTHKQTITQTKTALSHLVHFSNSYEFNHCIRNGQMRKKKTI